MASLKLVRCIEPCSASAIFRAPTSAAPLKLAAGPMLLYIYGMALTLEIPDSAVAALEMSPEQARRELQRDLAVLLYARGALSIGKSIELAGMARRDFEHLLKERGARRPFDEVELNRELSWNSENH